MQLALAAADNHQNISVSLGPFGAKENHSNFEGFRSYMKISYVTLWNKGLHP